MSSAAFDLAHVAVAQPTVGRDEFFAAHLVDRRRPRRTAHLDLADATLSDGLIALVDDAHLEAFRPVVHRRAQRTTGYAVHVAIRIRPERFRHAESPIRPGRSEEHTSELQSLMRISYAVFCLKKKITKQRNE